MVFYFLTNKQNNKEIKDYRTDIKYGYTSILRVKSKEIDTRYFFINTMDLPIQQIIGFSIMEPFNSIKYRFWYKRYENYSINEQSIWK